MGPSECHYLSVTREQKNYTGYQRHVVEELVSCGRRWHFGLEAGSKAELLIALSLIDDPEALLICNGYKDHDYIRLALLGRKLGKKIIIVVEQLAEIDDIIKISQEVGVKPMIGFRAKLLTRGEGKWATSTLWSLVPSHSHRVKRM